MKDHILILDPQTLKVLNAINLTFPDDIKFDVYRPFYFSEYV